MPATDFDFLPGRWHVANRRLVDTLDPDCAEWETFDATSTAFAMLGGLGNHDHFSADGYEGFSLRAGSSRSRSTRAPPGRRTG
jgi:hypothetical protein